MQKKFRYIVALDLGSESMAAYCRTPAGPFPINLQDESFVQRMMPTDPDYLMEGDRRSYRMRSEVCARPIFPHGSLTDEHALLEFFPDGFSGPEQNQYQQSLFTYIHNRTSKPRFDLRIPNPKLLFQFGVESQLPVVRVHAVPAGGPPDMPPIGHAEFRLDATTVVGHITCQVLRNFVFTAEPLREAYRDPLKRSQIHVVLTVPNVYSPEHVEKLRSYVERIIGVGRVSTMSESDAVVFKSRQDQESSAVYRDGDGDDLNGIKEFTPITQYLTIDIGKGTTDLSLLRMGYGRNAETNEVEEQVYVMARTGRSSGGSELTYLFVEHLENLLEAVYKTVVQRARTVGDEGGKKLVAEVESRGSEGAVNATAEKLKEIQNRPWPDELPISFLYDKAKDLTTMGVRYEEVVDSVVQLAELTKRAYTADHRVAFADATRPAALELATAIVRQLEEYITQLVGSIDTETWELLWKSTREELRQAWMAVLVSDLPQAEKKSWVPSFIRKAPNEPQEWSAVTAAAPSIEACQKTLRTRIDEYVTLNSKTLLTELVHLALPREHSHSHDYKGDANEAIKDMLRQSENMETRVVIAGQGAQFKPLEASLKRVFQPFLDTQPRAGMTIKEFKVIPSVDAKLACCQGALLGASIPRTVLNPHTIFGTLLLDNETPLGTGEPVSIINMDRVNKAPHQANLKFPTPAERTLYFCAGVVVSGTPRTEIRTRGSILAAEACKDFQLDYKPDEETTIWRLYVNGDDEPVSVRSYADSPAEQERRLWPFRIPKTKLDPSVRRYF